MSQLSGGAARAVRADDRRILVALAELDADGKILRAVLFHDACAERRAAPRPLRRVVLETRRHDPAVHHPGAAHAQLRVAHAHGPPLDLIAVEEPRPGPALMHGGELPAEIHHVADAGIHAEPAERREQVRGVAGEKDGPA